MHTITHTTVKFEKNLIDGYEMIANKTQKWLKLAKNMQFLDLDSKCVICRLKGTAKPNLKEIRLLVMRREAKIQISKKCYTSGQF